MKKWALILVFLMILVGLGAISYPHGFWGYFGASNTAGAASGDFAPCPYTSNIPDYTPAQTYTETVATTYTIPSNDAVLINPTRNAPSSPSYPSYFKPVDYSKLVVFCEERGYHPNPDMSACVPVVIPPHAHLSIWGNSYDCDPGYNTRRNACVADSYVNTFPN